MKTIGERIQILREEKNLKQKDLAEMAGITEATLSRYENGKREPRGEIVSRLANALNVSTDYLLGRTPIQETNIDNKLTEKDKKDIQKDLKEIMDEYREQKDGSKYYNGVELQDEDFDYLELAMEVALEKIKVKNKEKYTPKKFKK